MCSTSSLPEASEQECGGDPEQGPGGRQGLLIKDAQ